MNTANFCSIKNDELKLLQNCELDILKCTIKAIKELGLQYYAVGGTALGAVKYSGFVPWDDDIDIAMPRKDYDIFVEEAHKYLPSYLRVQSIYTDKNYNLGVTKIRNENTTFFDIYTAQFDTTHGVFIDIFPIDECGDTSPMDNLLYKMRENKIAWSNYFKPDGASFKNKVISIFCKAFLLFANPHKCALRNDKFLASLRNDTNSQNVFMRIEKHKRSYFNGGILRKFSGLEIVVPNNVEEYLTNCYGDYKTDPPIEKQFPHHFALKIDLKNSYKNYLFKKGKVVLNK